MGDKKGDRTTRQLMRPESMNASLEIQQVLKIPIKYVHVIRNPYDNIATTLLRALDKRTEASQGVKVTNLLSFSGF